MIELAGIGPGPHAAMVLADLGAEVVQVIRPSAARSEHDPGTATELLSRGKRSLAIDLKDAKGVELVLALVERAEVLVEGFRPGVTERLGVGPDPCLERNPALVYGRMTGWGQQGPLAGHAGHDIDYIATSGVLSAIGHESGPVVPLNLVGDFGGGSMLLVAGVLAALCEARGSGRGQVVDAAMVDGSALLMAMHYGGLAAGWWTDARQSNLLDGGAPFYTTYPTADGRHVAVGALEPQFYAELVERLGLAEVDLPDQLDREGWPALRDRFTRLFASRTRAEWEETFAGSDACVTGVYSMEEAPLHPHLAARGSFIEAGGLIQPAPAPRFSATPNAVPGPIPIPGADTDGVLSELGIDESTVRALRTSGVIA
ncbi:CaiB/BaiF CoA-transferase family protein [soil metagenome]